MRELTKNEYYDVIDALNHVDELDSEALYRDYSPRGGYGKLCFGIIYERASELYEFLVELTRQLDDEFRGEKDRTYATLANELARALRTDTLGKLSQVAYFPGFTLPEVDA